MIFNCKLGAEVLHTSVSLDAIAGPAEQLKVLDMVRPALGLGDDMVDLQVSDLEVRPTPSAVSCLIAVERPEMRPGGWQGPDVRPARVVDGAYDHRSVYDQLSAAAGERRDCDPPSSLCGVGGANGRPMGAA